MVLVFLALMQVAEPQYVVPCRTTITTHITSMYETCKGRVLEIAAAQNHVAPTTDMWTSRAGDWYI